MTPLGGCADKSFERSGARPCKGRIRRPRGGDMQAAGTIAMSEAGADAKCNSRYKKSQLLG
jgi:hypothetical protein